MGTAKGAGFRAFHYLFTSLRRLLSPPRKEITMSTKSLTTDQCNHINAAAAVIACSLLPITIHSAYNICGKPQRLSQTTQPSPTNSSTPLAISPPPVTSTLSSATSSSCVPAE